MSHHSRRLDYIDDTSNANIFNGLQNIRVRYKDKDDSALILLERVAIIDKCLTADENDCDYERKNWLIKIIAVYFAYVYNISRVYVIEVKSCAIGAWFDVDDRTIYLVCNEIALEKALQRSEYIRSDRICVNDFRGKNCVDDDKSIEKISRILVVCACIENTVISNLRQFSHEITLSEIMNDNSAKDDIVNTDVRCENNDQKKRRSFETSERRTPDIDFRQDEFNNIPPSIIPY